MQKLKEKILKKSWKNWIARLTRTPGLTRTLGLARRKATAKLKGAFSAKARAKSS